MHAVISKGCSLFAGDLISVLSLEGYLLHDMIILGTLGNLTLVIFFCVCVFCWGFNVLILLLSYSSCTFSMLKLFSISFLASCGGLTLPQGRELEE